MTRNALEKRSCPLTAPTLRRGGLALIPLILTSCSFFRPVPQSRGALFEKSDYAELVPGVSTKSDVEAVMGSPTSHATFDDNKWIYVSMMTTPQPLGFPKIKKQDVLVLAFDSSGVLRKINTLNRKDGFAIPMASETTPTPGTKINVLQQLIGNVGRYNPMSNLGSTFGGAQGPLGAGIGTGHGGTGNTIP